MPGYGQAEWTQHFGKKRAGHGTDACFGFRNLKAYGCDRQFFQSCPKLLCESSGRRVGQSCPYEGHSAQDGLAAGGPGVGSEAR